MDKFKTIYNNIKMLRIVKNYKKYHKILNRIKTRDQLQIKCQLIINL